METEKEEIKDRDDSEIFDEIIMKKPAFVKFYAPWCGYCKEIKPIWKKLEDEFKNKDIAILQVDIDSIDNIKTPIGKEAGNQGVPYILKVEKGGEKGKIYKGNRTKDDMIEFIEENFSMKGGSRGKRRRTRRRGIRRRTRRRTRRRVKTRYTKKNKKSKKSKK